MTRNAKPFEAVDRRPRMEFSDEYGQTVYVSKRRYDEVLRKVNVKSVRTVSRKVIIEYQSKCGKSHGVLILNDIGPRPQIKGERSHDNR